MEWLADNWVWILVGLGFLWFLSRGHAGIGCCGRGRRHGTTREDLEKKAEDEPISSKAPHH